MAIDIYTAESSLRGKNKNFRRIQKLFALTCTKTKLVLKAKKTIFISHSILIFRGRVISKRGKSLDKQKMTPLIALYLNDRIIYQQSSKNAEESQTLEEKLRCLEGRQWQFQIKVSLSRLLLYLKNLFC